MKTCLTIAGSDTIGGAGIQADLKTFGANGVYGMSVITALTAQNTLGVDGILEVPADFLEKQLKSVFSDIRPDAVKTGMLSDPEGIKIIAGFLEKEKAENIVVDPVMVSTSGNELINEDSIKAMCDYLLPVSDIITPNVPEAEKLSGIKIGSEEEMLSAGEFLRNKFKCDVLIKGGHLDSDPQASTDILFFEDEKPLCFSSRRIDNKNTHGTGCTLSSAIVAGLANGMNMKTAVHRAKIYVTGAIKDGLDLGKGKGPLNHFYKTGEKNADQIKR